MHAQKIFVMAVIVSMLKSIVTIMTLVLMIRAMKPADSVNTFLLTVMTTTFVPLTCALKVYVSTVMFLVMIMTHVLLTLAAPLLVVSTQKLIVTMVMLVPKRTVYPLLVV